MEEDNPRNGAGLLDRPASRLSLVAGTCGSPVRIDLNACRNILVIKLDYVGDWVLCTPFLENLRRNAPHATISAVVLDRVFELAAACPFVDRVIAITQPSSDLIRFRGPEAADAGGFRRDYFGRAFDIAIVPRWDADFEEAARIAFGSGAPIVVGFSEDCTRRKRHLNRGYDRFYTDVLADHRSCHEVEHNLALLEAMGGHVTMHRATVHTSRASERNAAHLLDGAFGGSFRPVLAIAPFASESKRMFPFPPLARLGRRLASHFGFNFVVVGSAAEAAKGQALAALLGPDAVSACGRLSLLDSAALIRRCTALLAMDSGPAHIAAAVGTPVAVLSCHPAGGSPDHPNSPQRFAPWGDASRILVIQPTSAAPPCRDGCDASEPHCILGIGEEILWSKVARFLHPFGRSNSDRGHDPSRAVRRTTRETAPIASPS